MYPAFNERKADIYTLGYYARDIKDNHAEFAATVFGAQTPMPAAEQRQTFGAVLSESVSGKRWILMSFQPSIRVLPNLSRNINRAKNATR